MAEYASSGLSVADVLAMIAANSALSFVSTTAMTVANLLANYPAGSANSGLYAHVTDLYNNGVAGGGIDEILRCRFDVVNGVYRWQPQRPDYNTVAAATGGAVTLTPLVTPPTVRLSGTLLGNLTVSPIATNAYVGQKFRVIQNSTLGLFTTTLTGLIGSNLTLLGNTVQDIEYTSAGWLKSS